ncbi:MAG: ABC transporter permease [Deltaproteobacteria bacterium]|nr:ABC transporter permease [Deltaproteobacteria bacterium]MBW2072066.1 ABC transporter permease [Deltaproteobacteria bacterium]
MKAKIINALLPTVILVFSGLCWEASVRLFKIPSYVLPGPWKILQAMWQRFDLLALNALVTLTEIALGFLLALIIGLSLAVLIHASRIMERALLPLVISSQTIPVFAIAPLLILWFGYGIGSKVVMTTIIVFFPIVINAVEGLRAADPDTLALLQILEASPTQIFFKVRVPQALPFVFAGIRIGVAVSVIGAVIGEWVGAREGLGYLMIHANAQLQVELVFAAIFWLSILGVVLYALVGALERLLVPWKKDESNVV